MNHIFPSHRQKQGVSPPRTQNALPLNLNVGTSIGEMLPPKDEKEDGRRTHMTDPSYSKRSKRDSEEKKANSVSVVVSVVGT